MPSGGGVFEVIVDGALVFSKKALGRHAEDGEVLPLVSAGSRASQSEPREKSRVRRGLGSGCA